MVLLALLKYSRMEPFQIGDQVIRYDAERTRAAYSTLSRGGANDCGCSSCQNFAAQRSVAFPDSFLNLLVQLGIDPTKEGEAYECGPDGSLTVYGGWFYFAGELVQPGERLAGNDPGFQFWFADGKNLPKPKADFGKDLLAVEFVTKLPWVNS
jgi:hypothetical protein